MNIPIQIKGSGETFDIATSEYILDDRQLFYHKQTHQLYIGDGSTPLKELKPIYSDIIDSIDDKAPNLEAVDSYYSYDANGEPVAVKKPKLWTFNIGTTWNETGGEIYKFSQSSGYSGHGISVADREGLQRIELLNDQPGKFAQYGFAISSYYEPTGWVTIAAMEKPTEQTTFTCILHYDI